jgi:type VI protein secretion system component VasK
VDILIFVRAQWDRVLAVVAVAAAVITLIVGWLGISGTPHVAEQLPYVISCGIAGLVYITIAATLWLSADLRDEWRELRILRLAQEAERHVLTESLRHDNPDNNHVGPMLVGVQSAR